jgi:hypothetical protein
MRTSGTPMLTREPSGRPSSRTGARGWTINILVNTSKFNNLKTINIKLEEQCGI